MSPPIALLVHAESLAAIECAWSLQACGFDVRAVAREGVSAPLARARGVEVVCAPAAENDFEAARAAIALLARDVDVVLPVDDAALLLCAQIEATPVAAPGRAAVELALDKSAQLDLAVRHGWAVPPTALAASGAPLPQLPPGPWVVKPAAAIQLCGNRLERRGVARCADESAVRLAVDRLRSGERSLVQTAVEGVGEGIFALARGEAEPVAWLAHRRLRMLHPDGAGASACATRPVEPDERGRAERLIGEARFEGPVMVESLVSSDTGERLFMEVNARPWGSTALARAAGFEHAGWACRRAIDPSFEPPTTTLPERPLTARHIGRDLRLLAAVARGPRDGRPRSAWPPLTRTAVEVLLPHRGERIYNWRHDQWRVFATDLRRTVVGR